MHESNPLASRHVLEEVHPFATAPLGQTLEGTRVAASANAAEVEEYRRQCEELLHAEEAAETTTRGGAVPPKADSAGGSGVSGSGERTSTSTPLQGSEGLALS